MVSALWTATLLSLAAVAGCAWLVALMRECGVRPVRGFVGFLRGQPKAGRVFIGAFLAALWIIAGAKPGGPENSGAPAAAKGEAESLPLQGGATIGTVVRGGDDALVVAGDKPASNGPTASDGGDAIATPPTTTTPSRALGDEDFARGLVLTRVGTGESFCFAAPPDATVCADWEATGAASDWIYLAPAGWSMRVGDSTASRLRVHSDGWAEALPDGSGALAGEVAAGGGDGAPAVAGDTPTPNGPTASDGEGVVATPSPAVFAPLRTALGLAPEAKWPLLPASARPSLLWHLVTPSNTLLVTWRNALLGRSPSAPVSLQIELGQGGSADFRYSLSAVPEGTALPAASACGVTAPVDRQVTSLGFASDLDLRCVRCLDGFRARLGGLDPLSCPPGSTNTVWEHLVYSGTADGAFTLPEPTDSSAVLRISVSGSGEGVLDVGGVPVPLVGVSGPAAQASAVSASSARPMRAPSPPPPTLLVCVPRGRTVPLYLRRDGSLTVSLSSGDFAFGVLPDPAGGTLSGWVNFPCASPTPACVHDYGSRSVTVTLPAGADSDGLRCSWSGASDVEARNVPPRSATLVASFSPRGGGLVTYALSHPLHLFGAASGTQTVRFCPVPPDRDPDRPDPYDPPDPPDPDNPDEPDDGDGEEEDPEPDEPDPSGSEEEGPGGGEGGGGPAPDPRCRCDRAACDGSCGCCAYPCCGLVDPDGYDEARTNAVRMSGVMLVREPPLFGPPIRLEVPDGDPRCCPCLDHARRRVELVLRRGLEVVGPDGTPFTRSAETVDVRVAATGPSRWPGDAFAAFATNGAVTLECSYTALGVGIASPAADLDALAALSPAFGLPVPVCTNADGAAALTLATDVLLGGMNIHVGFEGADAPFALWVRRRGGWRRVASSGGGALDVTLPAWRSLAGARPGDVAPRTEVRVTAAAPGSATLVFRAWGAVGGRFVEDEARRRITAVAPCLRADIDRDGRLGGPDDACRLAGRPFRFWFNGDCGKGDHAGQSGDLSPNAADLKVNGKLDLVNLFPVSVDATPFARAWGGAAEVRLRADSGSLRYCVIGEGFSPDAVHALASSPVHAADGTPLESAELTPLGSDGVQLGGLADAAQGPVFLAFEAAGPVGVHEGPEIVVTLGGAEVYRERLPVAIDSVDAMYRWVSLHGAECGSAVPAAFPGSCAGLPDSELSDGCVFFLHGFNVSEGDARAWNRTMFKRLWWAGSRARYCGVAWNGDAGLLTALSYHMNAYNAQVTAAALKRLVGSASGRKTVLAHSLGNMVVCEAIREGMSVDGYFMLNAAVASEALDGGLQATEDDVARYVPDVWKPYPKGSWCASWHALFPASDDRSRLRWRDAFSEVCDRTDVYNYYSTGDQVLEADSGIPSAFSGAISFRWPVSFSWSFPFLTVDRPYDLTLDRYAWQKQEVLKGVNPLVATLDAGWRFEADCTPEEALRRLRDGSIVTNAVFGHDVAAFHRPSSPDADVFRARAYNVPAISKPVGWTSVGRLFRDNVDLNESGADLRPNGWGRMREPYRERWLHSDIKDMSYYYIYRIMQMIVEQGGLR